jgi:hypothetical protein
MSISINKDKIIVVEGKVEEKFIGALLNFLDIRDYQIFSVGGKCNFKNFLPSLVMTSGFYKVRSLVVIRDADNNAHSAFQSICSIIRRSKAQPPLTLPRGINQYSTGTPRVGIFIVPGNSDNGILEDLFLQTVHGSPSMGCVNQFIGCISVLFVDQPRILSKAKSHAYLSVTRETSNDVGEAALKGYWDLNSPALDDLRTFLSRL